MILSKLFILIFVVMIIWAIYKLIRNISIVSKTTKDKVTDKIEDELDTQALKETIAEHKTKEINSSSNKEEIKKFLS